MLILAVLGPAASWVAVLLLSICIAPKRRPTIPIIAVLLAISRRPIRTPPIRRSIPSLQTLGLIGPTTITSVVATPIQMWPKLRTCHAPDKTPAVPPPPLGAITRVG